MFDSNTCDCFQKLERDDFDIGKMNLEKMDALQHLFQVLFQVDNVAIKLDVASWQTHSRVSVWLANDKGIGRHGYADLSVNVALCNCLRELIIAREVVKVKEESNVPTPD